MRTQLLSLLALHLGLAVVVAQPGIATQRQSQNVRVGNSLSGLTGPAVFGANTNAQLTIIDDEQSSSPNSRARPVIAAGYAHALALKADGSLWAWGDNRYGQLGAGIEFGLSTNTPAQVGIDHNWTTIAAGHDHSLAVKSDGSLWAWGGQLGLGDDGPDSTNIPVRIGHDHDWTMVAAGADRSFALKADGSLWAWGSNFGGLLGLGDDTQQDIFNVPTRIDADNDWAWISTAFVQTLALKTDGSLWAWGGRALGLGDGFPSGTNAPGRVGLDADWELVVTGGGFEVEEVNGAASFGVKSDGSLWSWGSNQYGQLGDETTVGHTAPDVVAGHEWVSIAAGWFHTLGVQGDGSLWAWGLHSWGALGLGVDFGPNQFEPARVGRENDWVAVAAGRYFSLGLKSDGSLWSWGSGALGLGDVNFTNVPTRIGTDNDWAQPNDLASPGEFRITAQSLNMDHSRTLLFTHTTARAYYVLYRGDSLTNIQLTVDATLARAFPLLTDRTPPATNATAFYRIRAVPLAQPLDSDGDGIDDVYELRHRIALNPLNPSDAAHDFDGDGRSNLQEYLAGTDPAQVRQIIAAGLNYTVLLKTDGSLWTWGDNAAGQLGDGSYDYREAPVRVGNDTDWIGVSAGRTRYAAPGYAGHTVGLKRDGSLWSWGDNHQGQLGTGISEESTNRPLRVGLDNDWSQVSGGSDYTLALKRDGSLWGWGGSGAVVPGCCGASVPIRIGHGYDWQAVAAGGQHALALKTDGSLWAWGNGNVGQLGLGQDVFPGNEPTRVGTDNDWTAIAASGDEYEYFGGHSLALKADGSLWSWGLNEWGQLGLGSTGQLTSQFSPARIGKDMDWAAIAASNAHSLARKRDGSLWLWGFAVADHPVRIGTNEEWTAFTVGGMPYSYLPGFALTLTPDGSLWSWSLQPSRNIPTLVGNDADWATVSGGSDHTLALTTNGVLKAWGANGSGQVGDRTIGTNRFSPILIDPVADWSAISAGPAHSLALRADGSLWTWGFSFYLQLCNGEFGVQLSPVRIGTASDWMRVAAGDSHSVALKNDGSLWSWGCNTSGQLGDGTTNGQSAPVRIDTDNDWVDFSTRNAHTVALKSDGSLWAWGANGGGQLTPTNLNTPVRIGSDNDWTAVSVGYGHTLGLKSNGSLWAWGQNYDGQLGDGTTMDRSGPVRIGTANDWVSISAGSRHNLGLKTNGTLWTWGWNAYAQLGDSTLATRTHPTQIGFDTDWTAIAAGGVHSLARKTDGTLWSWGLNDSGQLGFPADLTPHRVGTDTDWGAPP